MMLWRYAHECARSITATVVVISGMSVAPKARAQGTATGDLLILTSGTDTIALERVRRGPLRLDGDLLLKGANARFTYSIELDEQGGASRLRNAFRPASASAESPALQEAVVHFSSDSAIADIAGGGRTVTQRFATEAHVLPFINPSFAQVELMIQRARVMGGDSAEVPIWMIQGGGTTTAQVVRRGADSVVVTLGAVAVRLAVNSAGDIVGGTVPAQGLRLSRTGGGDSRAMQVEPPDYSPPPNAPYSAEEVVVKTPAGHTLAGTLTMPRGAARPVPAVVTITGSGPEDRDEAIPPVKGYRPFRQVADTLGRHGIAVLRLDDRGYGASTGSSATATTADFADDIRAALAYLRTRADIDPTRLALVGHSEGGMIAPMVAASDPALRGIVLLAGTAHTGRTILRYQLRQGIVRAPALSATQRDSALRTVDAMIDSLGRAQPWVRYFLEYDPLVTARKVRVPTLILQGETDRQVTPEQAEALERALRAGGNQHVTRRMFPQTNHLFVQDADGNPAGYAALPDHQVRAEVLAAMLAWLRTTLR